MVQTEITPQLLDGLPRNLVQILVDPGLLLQQHHEVDKFGFKCLNKYWVDWHHV